jgi:sulfatase maturation enzyme AslB (radical SAM superfamily)
MEWDTIRAAVELALRSRRSQITILFYGGEPLLEFPLIRRAVALVRDTSPPGKKVGYSIITNGTLLDDERCEFLAEHDFDTQLSFDGVPEAQDVRGKGTFAVLDRRLDRLRESHAGWFSERLSTSTTLSSRTLPHLAQSFQYFLSKRVRTIGMHPLFTHDPGWTVDKIDALDEQFARVFEVCKRHYERTGEVPFPEFRKTTSNVPRRRGGAMCGAASGEALTVDVDGQVFGCVTFADSFQKYTGSFLRSRLDSMRLGDLRDPRLQGRLGAYPEAARAAGLFVAKEKKYSSYARCRDCRYIETCLVCPTSIGHIPGNDDPHRVPDFECAFNLVVNKYRERFPVQADAADILRGTAEVPEMMRALRRAVEGLHRSPSTREQT